MKPHLLLPILLFSCAPLLAQEQAIKSVDPKTLSNAQVQQVQNQISNMGLTNQAAAELARQKGASEQQIQDMLKRLTGGEAQSETINLTESGQDAATTAALEAEKRDLEEQSKRQGTVSTDGGVFGSYLFNSKNLTFEPNLNIQTPKDYEISIGDQFIINIWGNSQANYQLTVDQNGLINVPNIGPVYLAGKTFESASNIIKQRLIAIYEEMAGRSPRTFAQVNLGQLRSIRINLVGEVSTPGTYTLPATATVFNALYLSGGPNSLGSFRNIKVFRDNRLIRTVDVYQFLINGNQSDNIVLKNDDVIFIPTAEKKVRMMGEFKRNAVFELQGSESLNDLIRFAGGFTEDTYLYRMQIYRKTQQGLRIQDILYTDIATTTLENGDMVISQKTLESFENRVTINGSVYRPGAYEWKPNMRLSELINKADSITPDAYGKKGHIVRFKPDLTQELITFNLEDVLLGQQNYFLEPEDIVTIKSSFQLTEPRNITVTGLVLTPGTFPFLDNMTLVDAIYLANGFQEQADSLFIQVSRPLSPQEAAIVSDSLVHVFTFALPRDLGIQTEATTFKLEPLDQIFVRRAPGYREQGTVMITGEAVYAGAYPIQSKEDRISDIINRAGGLNKDAYADCAWLERTGIGKVDIDLHKIIKSPGSRSDLYVLPGDHLIIPRRPETVTITGQVQNPFSTAYAPGKSLKKYISMSGGWGEDPYKGRVYVTYPDGSSDRTRSFIFRFYPNVKPGSVINVPKKPQKEHTDRTAQWIALATASSSLTVAIVAVMNMLKQ